VLPSIEEGLALVQAQAMACGVPVIATENTGAADLFTDGMEGFIVPIRDAGAIREKLLTLYENPTMREQMGEAALARVRKIGGWNDYGERAADYYRHALETRAGGANANSLR
jgi:starch synthase